VPPPQGGHWECAECCKNKQNNLLNELLEKARLKAVERERRKLEERQQKEDARAKR